MESGVVVIVAAVALGLLIAFGLWRRLPAWLALTSLAAIGGLLGTGGLLVQDRASGADWAVTLVALGVLTPLHVRLLFGRPGGGRTHMVAEGPASAYKGRNP